MPHHETSPHEIEFAPEPLDASALATITRTDLEMFNQYVEKELFGIRLFGSIVDKLTKEQPEGTRVDSDLSSAKVGLEIAALTGSLPGRLTDPDTPIVQEIYYAPITLSDDSQALLSEVVHRRKGVDSEVVARIPWLHILSQESLGAFQDGEIDFLTDVTHESYSQTDFDSTGRSDGEAPFSTAHHLFFSHPLSETARSRQEQSKLALLRQQSTYLTRLQSVAEVVLGSTESE